MGKWDIPMTSSHDIGWLMAHPTRAATLERYHEPPETKGFRKSASATHSGAFVIKPHRALTTPTNEHVLQKNQSAPELEQGPPPEKMKILNNKRWHRGARNCEVTKFTEFYMKQLHHSPFNQA